MVLKNVISAGSFENCTKFEMGTEISLMDLKNSKNIQTNFQYSYWVRLVHPLEVSPGDCEGMSKPQGVIIYPCIMI